VILFTTQSLTTLLPCASILESPVLPYSKTITTYAENNLARSYNLEYQYSDAIPKRTQLVSLQEQIGDKYLPKMKFSWKRFGYVESTRWHRYNTWKPPAVISSKMRIIDVTGDGLPDILQCASSSVTDCKSWINTGAGWRRNDAYKPYKQ
jgi:hypothetical protein